MRSKCGSWPDLTILKNGTRFKYEKDNDHTGSGNCFNGCLCESAGSGRNAGSDCFCYSPR